MQPLALAPKKNYSNMICLYTIIVSASVTRFALPKQATKSNLQENHCPYVCSQPAAPPNVEPCTFPPFLFFFPQISPANPIGQSLLAHALLLLTNPSQPVFGFQDTS